MVKANDKSLQKNQLHTHFWKPQLIYKNPSGERTTSSMHTIEENGKFWSLCKLFNGLKIKAGLEDVDILKKGVNDSNS